MTDPTQLPHLDSADAPNQTAASAPSLQDKVVDLLARDGYRPETDRREDIAFKVQGQQLFVRITEGEVDVMRVFGQWQIGEDIPRDTLRWLNTCNDVTLGANVVKCGLVGNTIVVSGEHVILKGEEPTPRLQLTVNMIMQAVQLWHTTVVKDDVKHASAADVGRGGGSAADGAGESS